MKVTAIQVHIDNVSANYCLIDLIPDELEWICHRYALVDLVK